MPGITDISFLTRPVQGYDNGGEIVKPNTAAQDLGISDSLTQDTITTFKPAQYLKNLIDQQVERIGPENLQDTSNRVTNRAVSEVSDRIAQTLKDKGYKISFDWKGFTNWMLGKDAQGNPKPFKSAKENRQALKNFIDKTPAGSARKIIIREGLNLVNQMAPNLSETVKDAWSEFTSTDDKPTNMVELQEKLNNVSNAKNDAGIITLSEKANKGFYKLNVEEKEQLANQFSQIVYDPVKKKALYELLSPQGKKVLSEYAKEKEYITGEQLKKLDTEQREYNEKSLKKDQAIINAYNNILAWKETELGKTDLTGRTLSGQRLADVMAGDDEYAKKLFSERAARNRVIQFLKPDLDEIGLTEIASVGSSVKVTEGKPALQLLQETGLSYFPKRFDFIGKNALNAEQKLTFDKAVTKIRSAMKEQDSDISTNIGRNWLRTNTNRMIRYAYDNNIPLDQVIEKVESFDADGIADILIKKEKHNKKILEFKELGYDVDFAEIGHIKAASEDALLSLDLDNLTLQYAKSNGQEEMLRKQIKDVIKNGKDSKYNINDIIAQLEYLGIKTKIGEDVYGKEIDVEKELRNLEIGASDAIFGIPYAKGGIVGISHLTRPL